MIRTFTELQNYDTLEDRYEYLKIGGAVGESTFGFDRYMNQAFYRSSEWRQIRNHVIARDMGMELGVQDIPIRGQYYVHHMNPLVQADIIDSSPNLLDPEFLICVGLRVHNAIHYGDRSLLPRSFVPRSPRDHIEW